ncbi:DUF1643 domain-containing protein [Thalassococcus sp. BH17M4-6]|uniref:DUF1643 domain-containing protein n=1 Tax=Thalassococcus sp. BH17M4-6 TaxID=3413148 RepID=UPI003BD57846
MIERRHTLDGAASRALYSPCARYRYALERRWGEGGAVLFVMLNPSTATELRNDPTIERCERRARAMGYGALMIGNLFAWRATRPADLRAAPDPEGPENAAVLADMIGRAALTIAAWGVHGAHREAAQRFARYSAPLHHLGLTKDGHPRHPLYVSYTTGPQPWLPEDRYPPPTAKR